VRWSPSKLRVALCYADHTHVLALRTGTSGGSGGGSRHGGRRRGGNRGHIGLQLQYVIGQWCHPLGANDVCVFAWLCSWDGAGICVRSATKTRA